MKAKCFAPLFAPFICIVVALASGSALAASVSVTGVPGTDGITDQFSGTDGTAGGSADAVAGPNADSTNSAAATGGSGGNGGGATSNFYFYNLGAGGDGGAATASAVTITSSPNGSASAIATGGNGGSGGSFSYGFGPNYNASGSGGNGGAAEATAVTLIPKGSATAVSVAVGGYGGFGPGSGGSASANSSASTGSASPVQSTAFAQGGSAGSTYFPYAVDGASLSNAATAFGSSHGGPVSASATVQGGNGGSSDFYGYGVAGSGGSASIVNGVSGSTRGPLTLSQAAVGGAAGFSFVPFSGAGGSATSSLTYVDGRASSLTGSSSATSGFGPGGNASATIALTSTRPSTNVTSNAIATSDDDFANPTANATAAATAVGKGIARADAITDTTFPNFCCSVNAFASATSQSNVGGGQSVSTTASGPANPQLEAITQSVIGGGGFSNAAISLGQVNSTVTGLPTSPVLTPNVAAAFASRGTVFGIGSMSSGTAAGYSSSLTYDITANFQFHYAGNSQFILGLMGYQSLGDGFQTSSLDVYLNSSLLADYQFADLASAQAFFSDQVIKLDDGPGGLADLSLVYILTSDQLGNNGPVNDNGFAFEYAFGTTNTPLPAALPLFATGLGGLGLLGWRRKRKNAATIAAA